MELYETGNPIEVVLKNKANVLRLPFGGGAELLPLCNMKCNMCFVRKDKADFLSAEEWIRIGESARDAGTLMMLLTGGEPLMHPGFREIYIAYQKMGLVVNVNTNGTLIDEKWADFFDQNRCRRINITLYGAGRETYGKLCGYPEGFDRTVNSLKLLKERDIPCRVNMTMVKENRGDLAEMIKLVKKLGLEAVQVTYEFPPERGGCKKSFEHSRMTPYEAAETYILNSFLNHPEADRKREAGNFFRQLTGKYKPIHYSDGFPCTAGKSGFWINWKGELQSCGMIPEPAVGLMEYDFADAWKQVVEESSDIETCEKCCSCRKKFFCQTCAAAMYTETGDMRQAPEYLCRMTDEMIKIMFSYLDDAEKADTRDALEACGLIYDF